jgi:hypothetical protein
MKLVVTGQINAPDKFVIPILPPTSGGYYTNFDLQFILNDQEGSFEGATITLGHPMPVSESYAPADGGDYEINQSKNRIIFTTMTPSDLMLDDPNFQNYHFHSKKRVYVSGKLSLIEMRIESHNDESAINGFFVLTADYIPFKNSRFVGRKRVDGLLSSEFNMADAFVLPLDIKNPKVKVTAKAVADTGDYNIEDLYLVALPGTAHNDFPTEGTITGDTLIKAKEAGQMMYGKNYLMHMPISTGSAGVAVASKFINTKLIAGDKLFVILDEDYQSDGNLVSLSIDIEVEGEVIYSGTKPFYTKAVFREGSDLVPQDIMDILNYYVGGA